MDLGAMTQAKCLIFRTTTNVIEKSDILNIHKYLQVKNNIK